MRRDVFSRTKREKSQNILRGERNSWSCRKRCKFTTYSGTSEERTIWGQAFCPLFRGCLFFRGRNVYRQGVNSVSIVGRLSILQSVRYQRFHCIYHYLCFFHCSQHSNLLNQARLAVLKARDDHIQVFI